MNKINDIRDALSSEIYTQLHCSLIEVIMQMENEFIAEDTMEIWAISEYLAMKLINKNETCFNFYGLWIWCRTCCGQSIFLDSVIGEIYNEIGTK